MQLGAQLLALLALLSTARADSTTAGFTSTVTTKGLNLLGVLTRNLINFQLKDNGLPGQLINQGQGTLQLDTSSVTSISMPVLGQASADPNTRLGFQIASVIINSTGSWTFKVKTGLFFLPELSVPGALNYQILGLSLDTHYNLTRSANNGLKLSLLNCVVNVGTITSQSGGSLGWLFDLIFKPIAMFFLQGQVQSNVCGNVQSLVNTQVNNALASLPTSIGIPNTNFQIDYSLVRDPEIGSGYIRTYYKGVAVLNGQGASTNAQNDAGTGNADNMRMITLRISEGMINSLFDLSSAANMLNSVTNYGAGENALLAAFMVCFNNCAFRVTTTPTPAPHITFASSGVSLKTTLNITIQTTSGGSSTGGMVLSVTNTLLMRVDGNTFKWTFNDTKFNIDSTTGLVFSFLQNLNLANFVNQYLMPNFLTSFVNTLGNQGIPIPSAGFVTLQNEQLTSVDGALLLATDIAVDQQAIYNLRSLG